jgi:hypothetical protein
VKTPPRAGALGALALALALSGCMKERPADLDLSTARTSEAGLYRVSYAPLSGPIRLNRLHAWALRVETAGGGPAAGARIAVDGGMPEHGHGLPTRPEAGPVGADGSAVVEGLRFNMPGWWVVGFTIEGPAGADHVDFNLGL